MIITEHRKKLKNTCEICKVNLWKKLIPLKNMIQSILLESIWVSFLFFLMFVFLLFRSYIANRVTDKLTFITDRIFCCRSGSAADTQAVADGVRYELDLLRYICS